MTVLHTFQVVAGYCVMFLAMTFNLWIFLGIAMGSHDFRVYRYTVKTVVLTGFRPQGSAIGYFAFGWRTYASIDGANGAHRSYSMSST